MLLPQAHFEHISGNVRLEFKLKYGLVPIAAAFPMGRGGSSQAKSSLSTNAGYACLIPDVARVDFRRLDRPSRKKKFNGRVDPHLFISSFTHSKLLAVGSQFFARW